LKKKSKDRTHAAARRVFWEKENSPKRRESEEENIIASAGSIKEKD